ncbi:HigA family addiction module antitoxin [Leifsonia sp. NPDC058248]|uniref:HigA family addiction module antitoxin n=1 Tax=Leifsonia sp. NPDC058248 TaxID=3346402 RepID=UPI0036D8F78F
MTEPIPPGEILLEEFMKPLGLTKYALAKAINVPAQRVGDIVNNRRAITTDTALRLSRAFGTSAEFWLNLQSHYLLEIETAEHKAELDRIHPLIPV